MSIYNTLNILKHVNLLFVSNISDPLDPTTSLSDIPVGTIIPWVPEANLISGLPEHHTEGELPNGWVHCDGSVIPEPSPWHGTTTPNLSGEQCFLFPPGNEDPEKLIQNKLQIERSQNKPVQSISTSSSSSSSGSNTNIYSKILRVFWIMRIW